MTALIPTEEQECRTLVQWAALQKVRLVHCPNGFAASAKEGSRMKKLGLCPGFPDYFVPYMRDGFGGMFVEMKRKCGGYASQAQSQWIEYLNGAGYRALICLGADNAINEIAKYLDL